VDEKNKNPLLSGQKLIIVLCVDDACKKELERVAMQER